MLSSKAFRILFSMDMVLAMDGRRELPKQRVCPYVQNLCFCDCLGKGGPLTVSHSVLQTSHPYHLHLSLITFCLWFRRRGVSRVLWDLAIQNWWLKYSWADGKPHNEGFKKSCKRFPSVTSQNKCFPLKVSQSECKKRVWIYELQDLVKTLLYAQLTANFMCIVR